MTVIAPNLFAVRRVEHETGIEHVFNPTSSSPTILKGALARGEALKDAIDTAGNRDTIILGTGSFILPENIVINSSITLVIRGISSSEPTVILYRSDATNPAGFDIQSQVQFINIVITDDTTFGSVTGPALKISGSTGEVQLNNCRIGGLQGADVFDGGQMEAYDSTIRGEEFAIRVGSSGAPGTKGTLQLHDCRIFADPGASSVTNVVGVDFIDGTGLIWDCNFSAEGGTSSNTGIKIADSDLFVAIGSLVSATEDSVTNTAVEVLDGFAQFRNGSMTATGDSGTNTAVKASGGTSIVAGCLASASGGSTATNVGVEASNSGTAVSLTGGTAVLASGGTTNTAIKQQSSSTLNAGAVEFDPGSVTGTVGPLNNFILRDLNDADPVTNNPAGQVGEVAFNSDNSSGNAGFFGRGSSAWVQLG